MLVKLQRHFVKLLFLSIFTFSYVASTFADNGDGQATSDKIATYASRAIYNLDTDQLRVVLEAFLKENPEVIALEVTENIDQEKLLSYHSNNGIASYNTPIPRETLDLPHFVSKVFFDGEEIGQIDVYIEEKIGLNLSNTEKQWLKNNPTIRVSNETNWPPFNFTINDKAVGLSVDIMNLVSEKTGLTVEYVTGPTWNEFLQLMRSGDLEVMLNIVRTPDREKYLIFTPPYANNPNTILSRSDVTFETLEDLYGYTVAVPKGFFYEEIIKRDHPKIKIFAVSNTLDSMKAVAFGEADAAFGELAVFRYLIDEHLMTDLSISGEVDLGDKEYTSLNLATRKDTPQLASILSKAIQGLSIEEKRIISNKWLSSNEDYEPIKNTPLLSLPTLFALSSGILGLFIIVGFFLSKLRSDKDYSVFFGAKSFRLSILFGLGILVLVIAIMNVAAINDSKKKSVEIISRELILVLEGSIERLNTWVKQRQNFLHQLGRDPQLVKFTKELLLLEKSPDSLLASDALNKARTFFAANSNFGEAGFFIISPNKISIGSRRDSNIGTRNFITNTQAELIDRAFNGESVFIPPIRSDVSLKTNDDKLSKPLTMFFAVPVTDQQGNVIAVMTERILPSGPISNILHYGRVGVSGETYAFNSEGIMVSESRFINQLLQIGLIKSRREEIEIRDPGEDISQGGRPDRTPKTRKLTASITGALDNRISDNTNYYLNVEGQRDYRGVMVVGASTWLESLGIGIVTEIDLEEAMINHTSFTFNIVIISAIATFMAVGATLFTLLLGQRAHHSLTKARDELEDRVHERTQELQISEERTRSIIENASDGIIVIDSRGNIESFSPAAERIFGYSVEEVKHKNIKMLMPKNVADVHDHYINRHLEDNINRIVDSNREVVGEKKDGATFPMDLAIGKVTLGDELMFVGIVRDVTERKHAEQVLADKEAQLRAALDNMSSGILMFDKDETVILLNNQYNELFEFPNDLVTVGGPAEASVRFQAERGDFGEGNVEEIVTKVMATLTGGKTITYERNLFNGKIVEINLAPTPDGGTVAIYNNVTKRKEAEAKVSKSEALMSAIVENVPGGVFVLDRGFNFTITNSLYNEIFKIPKGLTNQGMPIEGVIRHLAEQDTYNIETGNAEEHIQFRMKQIHEENPEPFEVEVDDQIYQMTYGRMPTGERIGIVADITKLKEVEKALNDAFSLISGSINYASRIQRSVLPAHGAFDEIVNDHLVIWEPRDVVGGDIYWCERWGNGHLLILGDCTGHGVPGAFMTLIATGALQQGIQDVKEGNAGELVSYMHDKIQTLLSQHDNQSESDDGMELGVCYIPKEAKTMTYSGARFDLFIVEDGQVRVIKGAKKGIGYKRIEFHEPNPQTEIDLSSSASYYMTSDGLIDQVGGEKSLMFGKKRFQSLLLDIQKYSMEKQKEPILSALLKYQGEQIRRDDISLVGFNLK